MDHEADRPLGQRCTPCSRRPSQAALAIAPLWPMPAPTRYSAAPGRRGGFADITAITKLLASCASAARL